MRILGIVTAAALVVTAAPAVAQTQRPSPAQVAALKALAQQHKAELQAAAQAARAAAQAAKAEGKSRREAARAAAKAARAAIKAGRP
jgi:hypothetical protein